MEKIHPIKMRLSLDYLREHSLGATWGHLANPGTILRSRGEGAMNNIPHPPPKSRWARRSRNLPQMPGPGGSQAAELHQVRAAASTSNASWPCMRSSSWCAGEGLGGGVEACSRASGSWPGPSSRPCWSRRTSPGATTASTLPGLPRGGAQGRPTPCAPAPERRPQGRQLRRAAELIAQ